MPLKDVFINCTSIEITEEDFLPSMICESCLNLLIITHKFRRKCKDSDLKLRNELQNRQTEKCNFSKIDNNFDFATSNSVDDDITSENTKTETKLHTRENKSKLQCDLCGKTFTKKSSLVYHLRIHSGQRNFICNYCKKLFLTSSQLSMHERKHNGFKPHTCKICNKSFTKSSNLKVHLLVHQNERRFVCNVCQKKFSQKNHLICHKQVHSDQRPYSCKCGANFITYTNYKRHINTHLGVKNYLCNFCGILFATWHDLKRHISIHSNDRKLFGCDYCSKNFTRLASLYRHVKKIHK